MSPLSLAIVAKYGERRCAKCAARFCGPGRVCDPCVRLVCGTPAKVDQDRLRFDQLVWRLGRAA